MKTRAAELKQADERSAYRNDSSFYRLEIGAYWVEVKVEDRVMAAERRGSEEEKQGYELLKKSGYMYPDVSQDLDPRSAWELRKIFRFRKRD